MTQKFEDRKAEKKTIKIRDEHPERESEQSIAKEFPMEDFINSVAEESSTHKNKRSTWENRQTRWVKQRFGIRKKKTFPFVGASNIHIPTIDKQIRKTKPSYVNLMWQPEQIAEFTPLPNAKNFDALQQEATYNTHLLDHIVRDKMDKAFEKSVLWVDRMRQAGNVLVKVVYKYEKEEREFTLDLDTDLTIAQEDLLGTNPVFFEPGEGDRALTEFFMNVLTSLGIDLDLSMKEDLIQMNKGIDSFRAGKKKIKFKYEKTIRDHPDWEVIDPRNVIVPGRYSNIQDSPFVEHRMFFTANTLRKMAKSGKFGKNGARVVEKILELNKGASGATKPTDLHQYEDSISKISGDQHFEVEEDKIEIRETYLYAMTDESGIMRKCVLTWSPLWLKEAVKFVQLPYDHQMWPFVEFSDELTSDGWLMKRGVPQRLDYLATTINVEHNSRRDINTIESAPMLKYVMGQVNPNNIKFKPGQGIPMKSLNAVEALQIKVGAGQTRLQEEKELTRYVENYESSPDFGQTDPNAPGNQARKATEILEISTQSAVIFGLDAKIFLNQFSELLRMTWLMWLQYGPETYEFRVKGTPNPSKATDTGIQQNQSKQAEPSMNVIRWQRNSIDQMNIRPKGSFQDTNPILRAQKGNQLANLGEHPRYGRWLKEEFIVKYMIQTILPDQNDQAILTREQVAENDAAAQKAQMAQLELQLKIAAATKQQDHRNDMDKENLKGDKKIEQERVKQEGQEDNKEE